jgi:predicted Zn-dependent peptidase
MTMNPQKHIFPSGLTLLTAPMPSSMSFTALVLVGAGSRYENKKNNGLSHFLEHMVFKGTKKYPNAQAIATAVDSIGAEFNAFTGKEYTGFYIKAASQHLEFVLKMLSQLVFHPLIPSAELNKERGVIIEEINMYEDNPMAKIGRVFEGLLYGDTPLGWKTIGTKKNILSVQKKDFTAYMDQWYQPSNMTIGIAGNVSSIKAKGFASYYFNRMGHGKPKTGLPEGMVTAYGQSKPRSKIVYKKTEQTHLCLGVRTFPRGHKYRYALGVLSTILGGNMSSRLFTEVREKKGLAYYIRTSTQYYLDNGYFVTQAGTDIKKSYETVKIIKQEYEKLASRKHGLTNKELVKAKEYLKGKLTLALEDSKEMAELFVEDQLMEGKTRTPEEILKAVDKVSLDEVLAVAEQVFKPENLNLAVIGPYRSAEKKFMSLTS